MMRMRRFGPLRGPGVPVDNAAGPSGARRLVDAFVRFARTRDGVAAIEFSFILPVMLLMYVGMSEYTQAITNWRKLTLLSRAVADLTAQGDQANPMRAMVMDDILTAATAILRPFNAANARIVVSAMAVDPLPLNAKPRVCSSYPPANARPVGTASDLTAPAGFAPASGDVMLANGSRYVLAEVSMDYVPMLGATFVKLVRGTSTPITFKVSVPWPARGGQTYSPALVPEVVLPGGAKC